MEVIFIVSFSGAILLCFFCSYFLKESHKIFSLFLVVMGSLCLFFAAGILSFVGLYPAPSAPSTPIVKTQQSQSFSAEPTDVLSLTNSNPSFPADNSNRIVAEPIQSSKNPGKNNVVQPSQPVSVTSVKNHPDAPKQKPQQTLSSSAKKQAVGSEKKPALKLQARPNEEQPASSTSAQDPEPGQQINQLPSQPSADTNTNTNNMQDSQTIIETQTQPRISSSPAENQTNTDTNTSSNSNVDTGTEHK
ncbi:hypothetical protein [Aneurinibacillus terranovensis]|uniref:hypothetical protein n=1 Tax=Aneurinibacillus terranovensis TaxID=278991 RepID=UPI0003FE78D9|nr:hypothetical protein [Aneurinibacillus terranovensis]